MKKVTRVARVADALLRCRSELYLADEPELAGRVHDVWVAADSLLVSLLIVEGVRQETAMPRQQSKADDQYTDDIGPLGIDLNALDGHDIGGEG